MGIVYIDEIDKISRKTRQPVDHARRLRRGVQQALLKLVEGTMASVPPQGGRKHPNQDFLQIGRPTSCSSAAAAFDGLEKVIANRSEKSGIGLAPGQSKQERSITGCSARSSPRIWSGSA